MVNVETHEMTDIQTGDHGSDDYKRPPDDYKGAMVV